MLAMQAGVSEEQGPTHVADTENAQRWSCRQIWRGIVHTGGIGFRRSSCWGKRGTQVTHPMIDPTVHVKPYRAKASVEVDSSVMSPYRRSAFTVS